MQHLFRLSLFVLLLLATVVSGQSADYRIVDISVSQDFIDLVAPSYYRAPYVKVVWEFTAVDGWRKFAGQEYCITGQLGNYRKFTIRDQVKGQRTISCYKLSASPEACCAIQCQLKVGKGPEAAKTSREFPFAAYIESRIEGFTDLYRFKLGHHLVLEKDDIVEDGIFETLSRPYQLATSNDPVAITCYSDQSCANAAATMYVEIGLKTKSPTTAFIPINAVILIDKSGSMEGKIEGWRKITLVKNGLKAFVQGCKDSARLTLMAFDHKIDMLCQDLQLDNQGKDKAFKLIASIDSAQRKGFTNIYQALALAFKLFKRQWRQGYQNRLILLTDGRPQNHPDHQDPNNTPEKIEKMFARKYNALPATQPVFVTLAGVGSDFHSALMHRLVMISGGNYHFLSRKEQIETIFIREFAKSFHVLCRNARLVVNFPKGTTVEEVVGYQMLESQKKGYRQTKAPGAQVTLDIPPLYYDDQETFLFKVHLPDFGKQPTKQQLTGRLVYGGWQEDGKCPSPKDFRHEFFTAPGLPKNHYPDHPQLLETVACLETVRALKKAFTITAKKPADWSPEEKRQARWSLAEQIGKLQSLPLSHTALQFWRSDLQDAKAVFVKKLGIPIASNPGTIADRSLVLLKLCTDLTGAITYNNRKSVAILVGPIDFPEGFSRELESYGEGLRNEICIKLRGPWIEPSLDSQKFDYRLQGKAIVWGNCIEARLVLTDREGNLVSNTERIVIWKDDSLNKRSYLVQMHGM